VALDLTVQRFWKLVSKDKFPKLKGFAQEMHSIFGAKFLPWRKSNLITDIELYTKHRKIVSDLL